MQVSKNVVRKDMPQIKKLAGVRADRCNRGSQRIETAVKKISAIVSRYSRYAK
jgi:hypothetical protein